MLKQFITRRWFLIVLLSVLAIGIVFAQQLEPLTDMRTVRSLLVAAVLFVMALPLEFQAVLTSLRRPTAPLLAVAVSFGLAPLLAWAISPLLGNEMGPGLLVAAAVPCTLASASVWTRRAGGNDSVAILVTIFTNATCFVVTPLWVLLTTGLSVELPLGQMIGKLAVTVVLPMMLAQLLRPVGSVGPWATRHKVSLGAVAQGGILTMVLLGAAKAGQKLQSESATGLMAVEIAVMIVAVLLLHLVVLAAGWWAARSLRLPREDSIAVAFSGSQKTIMVGLQVGLELGITILPMVAYHVGQLLVDTLIADRMKKKE